MILVLILAVLPPAHTFIWGVLRLNFCIYLCFPLVWDAGDAFSLLTTSIKFISASLDFWIWWAAVLTNFPTPLLLHWCSTADLIWKARFLWSTRWKTTWEQASSMVDVEFLLKVVCAHLLWISLLFWLVFSQMSKIKDIFHTIFVTCFFLFPWLLFQDLS